MPSNADRIASDLQEAVAHHRAGRLGEAEKRYKRVLQAAPQQPDALRLLAGIALQTGRHGQAETLARRALAERPENAELHRLLAVALLERGKADAAADSARQALALDPAFAPARLLLGNALHAGGDFAGAEREWRAVLAAAPDDVAALYNLAQLLLKDGRNAEARGLLDKAVAKAPTHAGALGLLGQARLAENPAQAATLLQRSIDLGNRSLENFVALGDACSQQKNVFGARAAYEEALRLSPRHAGASVGLAESYRTLEQTERALDVLKRALSANPDNEQIRGMIFDMLDALWRIDEGAAFIRNYLARNTVFGSVLCRYANLMADMPPAEIFAVHRDWGRRFADPLSAGAPPAVNVPDPERKLRIGYVSGDLRRHSVASFLMPVLRHADRERFEIHLFSNNKRFDAVTDQLRALAHEWHDIAKLDDDASAAAVRQSGIDILIDLSGHTGGHRLEMFARRPAPVQMTYLGYIDTTGMAAMDYRITDAIVDPPGQTDPFHTEKLLRLEGGYLCYEPLPVQIEPPDEPPSRGRGFATFGSCNSTSKLTRRTLQLWCQLLGRVPGSRLLLKDLRFVAPEVRRQFLDIFRANGIAADRIDLRDATLTDREHLATYNEIDIGLDPFPYNGVTTTCEALWMGVPVVTLAGQRSVSRHGQDILTRVGLDALIASSPEAYLEIAANLAADAQRLATCRAGLRQRMLASPLCDGDRIARQLEGAFRAAWRAWCERAPTSHAAASA